MLNRSAIVVKPKQPFLDWLHNADPTSHRLYLATIQNAPGAVLVVWSKKSTGLERRGLQPRLVSSDCFSAASIRPTTQLSNNSIKIRMRWNPRKGIKCRAVGN